MKDKNKQALLVDFLASEPGSTEAQNLRKALHAASYTDAEIEEFRHIYLKLDALEVPEPGDQLDAQFYSMLESASTKKQHKEVVLVSWAKQLSNMRWRTWGYQIAWSCALLLLGWFLGSRTGNKESLYEQQLQHMATEIQNVQMTLASTLLQQTSPAAKLQGMEQVKNFPSITLQIADALLQTLNFDPNSNVRLVALEALQNFTDNPHVRIGLVHSITNQDSPTVLLGLVNIMLNLQEKNAATHFQKLLQEKSMDNDVREKIEKSIVALL